MMKSTFTRMRPDSQNMVVEYDLDKFKLLCVECAWEGEGKLPSAPWPIFQEHPCRLVTESVSTND